MLEPVSALEPRRGFATIYSLSRPGSAISTEAQTVQQAASTVMHSVERSRALFGNKADAISQICTLANECADPDWDGDGALPMNRYAVFKAVDFIRALPDGLPMPECAPEPDGSISLDWILSRHRMFSVSVGTGNRLAYAWLDGSDKGHGVAYFDGISLPIPIVSGIHMILDHSDVAFRTTRTGR